MKDPRRTSRRSGALSRIWAMFLKELIQLRRDLGSQIFEGDKR